MRHAITSVIALAAVAGLPSTASAQCCVSDGNGAPKSYGLGQSYPDAMNVSDEPSWAVYEFARDGINYLQINDAAGGVRVVVGRIEGTFWVLPSGIDADRVRLPGDPIPAGSSTVIYSGDGVEIRRYTGAEGDIWAVVPAR